MLGFFKGLGIGLLCLLLFVAGVVFNVEFLGKKTQENQVKIERTLEVTMQVKPDIFTAKIDFYPSENLSTKSVLSEEEREQIAQTFKEIMQRSAKDGFCADGAYSLEANFSRENGFVIPKGQRLNANLECEIKAENLDAFNVLIEDINAIVAKSEWVRVSTPALSANFSKDLLAANREKLSGELLTKAYAYEKSYSGELDRSCVLSAFLLHPQASIHPRALRADAELSLPLINKNHQSVSATLTFLCK
ncbi:hypothetical protein [Campylobacter sp.]|uniref:hypothetical protein n=1 Tax=Campylobacter sp. TaxID=205 RepID=UPI0026DD2798|nr:hypothetical protein [Campylobacter sp.]MDO4674639.1 hypothetical protein [Campylobacter sp.]